MRHRHGRRGVSEIIGVLLMLAIVVSLGVLIFTFSSGSMNSLSENYAAAMTNRKGGAAEKFQVEQVTFSTGSAGTLATDGSATGCFGATTQTAPCTASTTTASTGTLTTTKSPDVIVVSIDDENAPNAVIDTVKTVTATGLTFVPRSSNTLGTPTYQDLEVWYAIASSAFSGAITVTLNSATDDAVIVAFGVSGANTASPWDQNPSLPATATGPTGVAPSVGGVATSNSNDIILGFQANGDSTAVGATTETAGSAFGLVANYNNGGGANDADGAAEDKVVTATQTGATVAFGTSITLADPWLVIADAIEASPAPIAGADVYVRNLGTVPTTLDAVYIVDTTSNSFVSQTTVGTTVNVGSYVDISHSTLAFSGTHGHTYSFTVTSSLGNSVVFSEEAT